MKNKNEDYKSLNKVLDEAFLQAAEGKGKIRHAFDEPFEKQVICQLTRWGLDYPAGQACKKVIEAMRLEPKDAITDLYGAINYIAAKIIVLKEQIKKEEK